MSKKYRYTHLVLICTTYVCIAVFFGLLVLNEFFPEPLFENGLHHIGSLIVTFIIGFVSMYFVALISELRIKLAEYDKLKMTFSIFINQDAFDAELSRAALKLDAVFKVQRKLLDGKAGYINCHNDEERAKWLKDYLVTIGESVTLLKKEFWDLRYDVVVHHGYAAMANAKYTDYLPGSEYLRNRYQPDGDPAGIGKEKIESESEPSRGLHVDI